MLYPNQLTQTGSTAHPQVAMDGCAAPRRLLAASTDADASGSALRPLRDVSFLAVNQDAAPLRTEDTDMKLSPQIRYAARILFELAESQSPIPLAALSEKTGVSVKTAESVHSTLKAYGITDAIAGPRGGVFLTVELASLSLGRLVEIFDGGVAFTACCGNKANDCPNQSSCSLKTIWASVSATIQRHLDSLSLEGILYDDAMGELEDTLPSFASPSGMLRWQDRLL